MSCGSAFNFRKRQEWGGIAGSMEDRTDGLDSPDRVTPPGQSSPPTPEKSLGPSRPAGHPPPATPLPSCARGRRPECCVGDSQTLW